MHRWLFNDWGVKLGAGLLAAALWFHAVTERAYRRELDVPLVVENPDAAPGRPIVIASPVPPTVRIAVFGGGKDLLRASGKDFLLRVQTPSGPAGRRVTLRLEAAQVEAHSDLDLSVEEVLRPTELSVLLDHSEERLVPVRLRLGLRPAESYTQVGPARLEPDSVRVRGPRSHLRDIVAIDTDSLVRTDLRDAIDFELDLQVPSGRLLQLSQERVRVAVDVQELAEYELLNVPVTVIGGPQGAVAEPSRVTVRVRGGADLIGGLDPETAIGLQVDYRASQTPEGGIISAPADRLFEVRQIIPARATVEIR